MHSAWKTAGACDGRVADWYRTWFFRTRTSVRPSRRLVVPAAGEGCPPEQIWERFHNGTNTAQHHQRTTSDMAYEELRRGSMWPRVEQSALCLPFHGPRAGHRLCHSGELKSSKYAILEAYITAWAILLSFCHETCKNCEYTRNVLHP